LRSESIARATKKPRPPKKVKNLTSLPWNEHRRVDTDEDTANSTRKVAESLQTTEMYGGGQRGGWRQPDGWRSGEGGDWKNWGNKFNSRGGGCLFCKENEDTSTFRHGRLQCPEFKRLKQLTSRRSYLEVQLKPSEEEGFAAAGNLLWQRGSPSGGEGVELLMAREYRPVSDDCGGDKLNFLGGKRRKKSSTAISVAVDKLNQETGGQLSPGTRARMLEPRGCPLVCWSAESKYVLYLFELTEENDREIDVRCAGLGIEGVKRLEWVSSRQLLDSEFVRSEMHLYAAEMLNEVIRCNVLSRIEDIFDVAIRSAATACEAAKKAADKSTDFFDVIGALRSSMVTARPDEPAMKKQPSYRDIMQAVRVLSKEDLEKLKLRFHPSRLTRALGRTPTESESAMSTKAMQLLNTLSTPNEASTMALVAELESLRAAPAGSGGATPAVDELAAELASIKLSAAAPHRTFSRR
jgi:hypothetical protein